MRPAVRPFALATLAAITALTTLVADPGSAAASARPLRDYAGPYQLQLLVEGQPARTFDHGGETWVLGQLGNRYTMRVVNRSGRRIEAVVTVDGRDVIDGKPGDYRSKRGYRVPAWGSVDIDGWRISQREAAAFRFSSVSNSYAARTGGGREVGVVGVAIFPERVIPRPRPIYVPRRTTVPAPDPWYGDRDARPDDESLGSRGGAAGPPPASSPPARKSADAAGEAAAPSSTSGSVAKAAPRQERSGLGTEYGESVSSEVHEVEFVRANAYSPSVILGARYNDHDGLVAMGIPVDEPHYASDGDLRETAEPFPTTDRRYAAPPPGWSR